MREREKKREKERKRERARERGENKREEGKRAERESKRERERVSSYYEFSLFGNDCHIETKAEVWLSDTLQATIVGRMKINPTTNIHTNSGDTLMLSLDKEQYIIWR